MPKLEFLQRAHSEKYGDSDMSNWKDLRLKRNWNFVDPGIRSLVRLLNRIGFTTFSSCSGGHESDRTAEDAEHYRGYLTFSPPSRIVFKLYLALQKENRRFEFGALAGVNNEGASSRQTVYSKLEWQLEAYYSSKLWYYSELFEDMTRIVQELKPISGEGGLLSDILKEDFVQGNRIIRLQQRRFR